MKVSVQFDDYESALIRRVRRELTAAAKRKGEKPPKLHDIVRGAVRMGVHAIYGENYVADDLLDPTKHPDLARIDSSQFPR